jgi:hypothetical protein
MLFNDSVQLRDTESVILNRSRRNYFNSIIFLVMRWLSYCILQK